MTAFQKLTSCLQELQFQIGKFEILSKNQSTSMEEIIEEIQTDMEQNINKTMQILESTSKSLGFTLTIRNLFSQQQFDMNSEFTVNYRNLKFTGNEKQVIANEEINQKFVLPILEGKQTVLIEVWRVEGDQKQVFNTFEISLRDIIGLESESNTYSLRAKSLKQQPLVYLDYVIQVRGFGFDSWKKYNQGIDEEIIGGKQEKPQEQQNTETVVIKRNERAEQQKSSLNKIFENRREVLKEAKLASFDSNLNELDEIMNLLGEI